ncbi:MAG: stage II sporulation protein M [Planctomycetota bacterium]
MPLPNDELAALGRFEQLLGRVSKRGPRALSDSELDELVTLYRFSAGALARVREASDDPSLERKLNGIVATGYAAIYATKAPGLRRIVNLLLREYPRRIVSCRVPLLAAAGLFISVILIGYFATASSPGLAYTLFDPREVANQERLLQNQESFKGNFTFNQSDAPFVAPMIAGRNIQISALAFAGGVLVLPTLYVLFVNGMMVGVLFGLAAASGRFFDMYNLLMCHGTLELTAIVIAAGAGLRVGFAVVAPGDLPRRRALAAAASDAGILLFGVAATLLITAAIEAFVTPFSPPGVRMAVGIGSGLLYILFIASGARVNAPRS